jgi:hypothetical protein
VRKIRFPRDRPQSENCLGEASRLSSRTLLRDLSPHRGGATPLSPALERYARLYLLKNFMTELGGGELPALRIVRVGDD